MPPVRKHSQQQSTEGEWYFENAVIGTVEGPYSASEMRRFWDIKRINSDFRVWNSQLCREWRTIRTLSPTLRAQVFGVSNNNLHHKDGSILSSEIPNVPTLKTMSARSSRVGLSSGLAPKKRRTVHSPRKKRRMMSPRSGSVNVERSVLTPCLERTMSAQSLIPSTMMSLTPDRMKMAPSPPVISTSSVFVERRPPFHPCLKYYPSNPIPIAPLNRPPIHHHPHHPHHPPTFVYNAMRHNSPPRAMTKQPMTMYTASHHAGFPSTLYKHDDHSPSTPLTPSKLGRHPPPGMFPDHLLPQPKKHDDYAHHHHHPHHHHHGLAPLSPLMKKSISVDTGKQLDQRVAVENEREEEETDTTLSSSVSEKSQEDSHPMSSMIDDDNEDDEGDTLVVKSPVFVTDASLVQGSPLKVRRRISQRRRKRQMSMIRSQSVHHYQSDNNNNDNNNLESDGTNQVKKSDVIVYPLDDVVSASTKRLSMESSVSLDHASPCPGLSLGKPLTFAPCLKSVMKAAVGSDGDQKMKSVNDLKLKLKKHITESEYRLQCDIRNRFANIHAEIDSVFALLITDDCDVDDYQAD